MAEAVASAVAMPPWRADPSKDSVNLGKSSVKISPIGVGTWAWGDKATWKWDPTNPNFGEKSVEEAVKTSVANGVKLFDTAELYGQGTSEKLVGAFTKKAEEEYGSPVMVATKYIPLPWQFNVRNSLIQHLKGSLERLGRDQVDLYQIHGPAVTFRSVECLAEALGDAFEQGLTKAVGVCNFNEKELRKAHQVLAKRGIPLASNQVEFSLLRRLPETSGLLKVAEELGVTVLAYSPLAMGRLTGKYSVENPPPGGSTRRFGNVSMNEVEPLLEKMRKIAESHNKTPSQVALNWCMSKGTVPIPGAKNAKQAEDNAKALGWRLTDDEILELDSLSTIGTTNWFWQHG